MTFLSTLRADAEFHTGRMLSMSGAVRYAFNPSVFAASLFRVAARDGGIIRRLARWACIVLFSSDVSSGVKFTGAIDLPHPVGIVIGRGAVIGNDVRIYQNVTIGSSPSGAYPAIGDRVTIYSNAVVAGGIVVGNDAIIGANCTVTRSVVGASVVKSTSSPA